VAESKRPPRTGRDDSDLDDGLPTPSQSGSAGGSLANDVGSLDEARNALGGDPEPTRATKRLKQQPRIPTRSDHSGAAGLKPLGTKKK
jgi:hypothetical protein